MFKTYASKTGNSPGSIVYTGNHKGQVTTAQVISYTNEQFSTYTTASVDDLSLVEEGVHWININGVSDADWLYSLGEKFNISSMVLEDIAHVGQRAKIEISENYTYIVMQMLSMDDATKSMRKEQISFIYFKNTLITFLEDEGDLFDRVRQRIQAHRGRTRTRNTDYLLYRLIDTLVDEYFKILSNLEEKVEDLEENMLESKANDVLQAIYSLRKELLILRASIFPIKEMIETLLRLDTDIDPSSKEFYADIIDHAIRINDSIIFYREMINGLYEMHLSRINHRMNQIMTTLTLFSAIFIPLTFFAGVYGMNFHYMPELSWKFGYPLFLIICVAVALGMHQYFKHKKWM